MKKSSLLLLPLLAACAFGHAVAGVADVRFVEPKQYRDAGFGEFEIGRTTAALAAHLQTLAKVLPAGQVLKVEVLDVDLAGVRDYSNGRAHELRIARGGADWPRIKLRFELLAEGRTLRSGEDDLVELNYLWRRAGGLTSGAYEHEFRLLDRWFAERVAGVSR